jgi:hypothetical protein
MFISKAEKAEIIFKIRSLEARVRDLELEAWATKLKPAPEKKRKPRPEAARLAASERMKKYWADRKAKKETS